MDKNKKYYDQEDVSKLLKICKDNKPKSNTPSEDKGDYFDKISEACEKLNKDLDRKFDE